MRRTRSLFEAPANLIAKALQNAQYRLVNFIWHGGEPLLLGQDFFRKVLTLQQSFLGANQYVTNSLQTNGTLLTPEWCAFFKRNKFNIGVSVDGPEAIHNLNRSYASGEGSFGDVVRACCVCWKMLICHTACCLSLTTIHVNSWVARIFDFIINDCKVKNFSFLPAVPDNIPDAQNRVSAPRRITSPWQTMSTL